MMLTPAGIMRVGESYPLQHIVANGEVVTKKEFL